MPRSAHRRPSLLKRLKSPRAAWSTSQRPVLNDLASTRSEAVPLLPLTIPDLLFEPLSHSVDSSTMPATNGDAIIMNVQGSPSGNQSKTVRSKSILGTSRKVVSSAVRRPLRAVGRAVSRRDSTRTRSDEVILEDDDAECETGEERGLLASTNDKYGTLVGIANGDGEDIAMNGTQLNGLATVVQRNADWPVKSMEQAMRTLLLISVSYMLGVKRPQWYGYVLRGVEYVGTAWITCVAILGLVYIQKRKPQWLPPSAHRREEVAVVARGPRINIAATHTPKQRLQEVPCGLVSVQRELAAEDLPGTVINRTTSLDSSVASVTPVIPVIPVTPPAPLPSVKLSHPAMSCLYILDATTGERIYANKSTPTHISTEWFEMDMMVLIRTPDVDDPKAETGFPCNNQWVDYLRGRQRRFEFQYQIKLKKVPQGKAVYFSCELEEPIKMGLIQRAFVGAAMAFMKSTNPTFHYSITGSKERTPDGKYEKPHMSFTVEGSLDRLVVSKPGETPPQLGTAIEEDPESIKRRKKGTPVDWNLEDTYTMALWSAYVDFLDWRVINLPGIRPFGLSSVLGPQPFYLTMYLIEEKRDNDKHYQRDITNVINLELSNDAQSEKGNAARLWAKEHERKQILELQRARTASQESITGTTESNSEALGQCLQANKLGDDPNADDGEDDDAAETAAELGEGIYLRSGDSVCLREVLTTDDDNSKVCCVANGGGFAVMQEQDVTVIIEKTRRSKKNRLIKSGDTVMFKMIYKKNTGTETRYLSIHRGWWLKWVVTVPSKNGFFTVDTQETEFYNSEQMSVRTNETQSSYLTMGGSFTLRHRRWSRYFVGVAGDPSPTYGGRMLGLYDPEKSDQSTEEQYQSDEGETEEADAEFKANKPKWMRPLVLMAIEQANVTLPTRPVSPRSRTESSSSDIDENSKKTIFAYEHYQADVPAWIEMMNRTERVRQLTYVVRVARRTRDEEHPSDHAVSNNPETFLRLRTGRELAKVMRVGQSARYYIPSDDASPSKSQKRQIVSEKGSSYHSRTSTPVYHNFGDSTHTPSAADRKVDNAVLSLSPQHERRYSAELPMDFSFDGLAKDEDSEEESIESLEEEDGRSESDEGLLPSAFFPSTFEEGDEEIELESELETDLSETEAEQSDGQPRKKRGMLGKSKALLGKSVKATAGGVVKTAKLGVKTTKLTGKAALATGKLSAKAVVGASKLTGKAAKGTTKVALKGGKKAVNAGKSAGRAVIAPVSRKSKKPPRAEPKTKHKEKDHVAVARSMKKMAKLEKKSAGPPSFLAGELCAPEQSRRTASRVLSRMSGVPFMSPHWKSFNSALTSQIQFATEQDRWFLEGTSVELGVIPLCGAKSRGKLLHESLLARCLWESHWREEWCGMYDSCLSFYTPLSKAPCTEIAYVDISNVRPLDAGAHSPLPGFPLLVLETAWLCHYVAFRDEEARDTFGEKVEHAVLEHIKQVEESASLQEEDLRKARFWQGFQRLSESSLSSGTGKWAKISSKEKAKDRVILNGRRMAFDDYQIASIGDMSNGLNFVEDLLSKALSFSLESLEENPASFVEFLDLTSQLRILPLDELDLSSKHAFCLFANIYHCLLQQAMLLSVNGPLHKKSVMHFMRTACYEIGGDVFSLAELYCCVLRGKMTKPLNPKPPYIEAPKKSQAYRHYALDYKDPRVNFVLNTGDIACPRTVPILCPNDVEHQLNEAATIFLQEALVVDAKRHVVVLPKVCEIYKNDFGGDSQTLKFCMGGLDEGTASTIRIMMVDMHSLTIRYQHTAEQYHTSLKLRGYDNLRDEDEV